MDLRPHSIGPGRGIRLAGLALCLRCCRGAPSARACTRAHPMRERARARHTLSRERRAAELRTRVRPELGQFRPDWGRCRPMFRRYRSNLSRLGHNSTELLRSSSMCSLISAKLGFARLPAHLTSAQRWHQKHDHQDSNPGPVDRIAKLRARMPLCGAAASGSTGTTSGPEGAKRGATISGDITLGVGRKTAQRQTTRSNWTRRAATRALHGTAQLAVAPEETPGPTANSNAFIRRPSPRVGGILPAHHTSCRPTS